MYIQYSTVEHSKRQLSIKFHSNKTTRDILVRPNGSKHQRTRQKIQQITSAIVHKQYLQQGLVQLKMHLHCITTNNNYYSILYIKPNYPRPSKTETLIVTILHLNSFKLLLCAHFHICSCIHTKLRHPSFSNTDFRKSCPMRMNAQISMK